MLARYSRTTACVGAVFACSALAFAAPSVADHMGRSTVADGISIHMGLMPVKTLRRYPDRYPKHAKAKIPTGKNVYHLMLALFDQRSGKRITDAYVEATVRPLGLSGPTRHLHPVVVAGVITYCNYFKMSPTQTYRVLVNIRGPNSRVTRARFLLKGHR